MTILDGCGGYWRKCDSCGDEMRLSDEDGDENGKDLLGNYGNHIRDNLWIELFNSHLGYRFAKPDEIKADYCLSCAKKLTPWVYRLLDIFDLKAHLYKLEKEIRNVKRAENDRSTENASGECCKVCGARRNGYTESGGASQAGEEHY